MFAMRLIAGVVLFATMSFAGEVAWVKDYKEALRQASEQKKFVVLDMSASWCGYCRRMAKEVYPDPQFVEFSRGQVYVRLFADTDPQGPDLSEKYQIEGFPTILVLTPKGEEVGRVMGARSRDRLIDEITRITRRASSPN